MAPKTKYSNCNANIQATDFEWVSGWIWCFSMIYDIIHHLSFQLSYSICLRSWTSDTAMPSHRIRSNVGFANCAPRWAATSWSTALAIQSPRRLEMFAGLISYLESQSLTVLLLEFWTSKNNFCSVGRDCWALSIVIVLEKVYKPSLVPPHCGKIWLWGIYVYTNILGREHVWTKHRHKIRCTGNCHGWPQRHLLFTGEGLFVITFCLPHFCHPSVTLY